MSTLEMMRQNLRETLRETSLLRRVALEEEVLIGAENIDKTCNSMLRHARQIKNMLTASGTAPGKKR
ncbi:hypothetical protein J2P12_03465 [Candidatus Bathyarchaeota archaeon]|nr:hypothetical protein [Candidatus Bathyarchaeota archaeon]